MINKFAHTTMFCYPSHFQENNSEKQSSRHEERDEEQEASGASASSAFSKDAACDREE